MKTKFVVSLVIPRGVTIPEMKNYIYDAVESWAGSLNPHDDPLFDLDRQKIRVTRLKEKKET